MRPQGIEQPFTFRRVHPDDGGVEAPAEVERLAAGVRMGTDDRVPGAGNLGEVGDIFKAGARLLGAAVGCRMQDAQPIDPARQIMTPGGRPQYIVKDGQVARELLA